MAFSRMLPLGFLCLAVPGCGIFGGGNTDSRIDCDPGERAVSGACVPEGFWEVSLEPVDGTKLAIDPDGTRYVQGVLLVGFSDASLTVSRAAEILKPYGGRLSGSVPIAGLYRLVFDDITSGSALDQKLAAIAADPAIDVVERDLSGAVPLAGPRKKDTDLEAVAPGGQEIDSCLSLTHPNFGPVGTDGIGAYTAIGVQAAWDAIFDKNPKLSPVVVGVVDEAIDVETVFAGAPFAGNTDFTAFMAGVLGTPDRVHGTIVASVIAAPNDKMGMNGILTGLSCIRQSLSAQAVMGVLTQAEEQDTKTSMTVLIHGIVRAVRNGSRVVNLSLAYPYDEETVKKGFKGDPADLPAVMAKVEKRRSNMTKIFQRLFAAAPRVLFVTGAGNAGADASTSVPASAALPSMILPDPNVMAVAALDNAGGFIARSTWGPYGSSNFGSTVTIAAPGSGVLVTVPGGPLADCVGTSVAAPMVSGVAGLVFAIRPGLKGAEVRRLLVDSADTGIDATVSGRRVNALKAVQAALALVPPQDLGQGDCREKDPVQAPPTPGKVLGHIFLGATPMGAVDAHNQGLHLIDPTNGRTQLLSPQPVDGLAVSPDGTKLAAGMLQANLDFPYKPRMTIFEIGVAGATLVRSVSWLNKYDSPPEQLTQPTWLSDSETIAVDNVGYVRLYRYSTEAGSDKLCNDCDDPTASATGSELLVQTGGAFVVIKNAGKGIFSNYDPFDIDAHASVIESVDPDASWKVPGSQSTWHKPVWSPVDRRVLFLRSDDRQNLHVVTLGTDASAGAPETFAAGGNVGAATWSPDGKQIAYAILEAASGNGGVWVLTLADPSNPVRVLKTDLHHVGWIDLAWAP